MALIKYGPMVSQISGSTGGQTFSHNRYGAYVRQRSVPVNPNSNRQNAVRTLMATLTSLWQGTLTSVQREQWTTYGANVAVLNKVGESVYLTGLNHYVRSNLPRLLAGLTRIDPGPVIFTLPVGDTSIIPSISAATQDISVIYDDSLGWCDIDGASMLCYGGIAVNDTINFFGGPFRYSDKEEGDSATPPTSPFVFSTPFVVQEDQKIWVQARVSLADGRLSNFFRASCICAA